MKTNNMCIVAIMLFYGGCMASQQTLNSNLRNELRGTIYDEEQGELSIGQSVWRYEDGKFLVYGGDSDRSKIYYVLVSDILWGNIDIEDFAPYPQASFPGELSIAFDNKERVISFGKHTLLVHIDCKGDIIVSKINIEKGQWRKIMQPYVNNIQNSDLNEIYKKLWALPRVNE